MSETSNNRQSGDKRRFVLQFRVIHVVCATAMFCTTLATFGPPAVVLAVAIVAFWGYVFSRRPRSRGLIEACLAAAMLSCLLCLPAVSTCREAVKRMQCNNNLKQIALALHNYYDAYGEFPPAYIADRSGKPMHSWRVLLLPFLEETGLYAQYHFDEPWDGPNNRQLLDKLPKDIYRCPSDPRQKGKWTSYVAVVGPRTMWPGPQSRKMSDVSDGPSNTIMVVECQSKAIAWTEPRDLGFDEALRLFTAADAQAAGLHPWEDFFFTYYGGRNVVFADGFTRFVGHGVNRGVWSASLTVDDGAKPDDLQGEGPWIEGRRLNIGNCFRLALFLLLLVLPLPWVWLGQKRTPSPTAIDSRSSETG